METSKLRPLDRAKATSGLIRDHALEAEQLGRLTDSVGTALLEAGLFSMLLPTGDDGLGCDRAEFFETVEEVARADGSAGWRLSVAAAFSDFINRGGTARAGTLKVGFPDQLKFWFATLSGPWGDLRHRRRLLRQLSRGPAHPPSLSNRAGGEWRS